MLDSCSSFSSLVEKFKMKTNHWYLPCLIIGGATTWLSSVAAMEPQQQQVFMHQQHHSADVPLHGRYLHITDIHVREAVLADLIMS